MKKYVFLIVLLICAISIQAEAQTWQWAAKASSSLSAYGSAIDVDNDGNSYVAGTFYGSISFGTITLTNPGLNSIYIAKYDASGGLLWAKLVASATNINVYGISTDQAGNMSITGIYSGSGMFGSKALVNLTSTGDYDVFVARYDTAGTVKWAKSAGDTGFDYASGISKDAAGNVYITGEFHITSYTGSASKIFIAKYDNTGNCLWTKMPHDYSNFHLGNGIKTDSAGNSYFTGQFFGGLTFDSTIILDAGNREANAYIGKINTDGVILWLEEAGAPTGYTGADGIDIDKAGNAYVTGFYKGTISFGSLSLTDPEASYYMFIAKCNTNGKYVWVNRAHGAGSGTGVGVDNAGNCYFTGYFNSAIIFGTDTLTNAGNSDNYITKTDSLGNFVWATQCGGMLSSSIGGVKANAKGIFLTGTFTGTSNFGTSVSLTGDTTAGSMFVAKIKSDGATGIPMIVRSNYSLYPNPAKKEIQFNGTTGGEHYTIYDVNGKIMDEGILSSANKISVENLVTGNYFICLADKDDRTKWGSMRFTKY